jgi:Lectin C-type domain
MRPILICVLFTAAATAADDPVIQRADSIYSSTIKRVNEAAEKARRDAAKKRLQVYESQLRKATRAGDFNQARELNRRIQELRKKDSLRPRPKNTVQFGGHTYALIDEKVTWHVAKRRCEEMGGQLVCIEAPQEAAFIARLTGRTTVWAGATDEEREGQWFWVNGKPIRSAPWADNAQGLEHHLAVTGRKWNDWFAGGRLAYICEWE